MIFVGRTVRRSFLGLLVAGLFCTSAPAQEIPANVAKALKITKPQKLKPAKPLDPKAIEKANKKIAKATSAKAIRKASEKAAKQQRDAFKKANKQSQKANKAMRKAYAKAIRDAQKQAALARKSN